ncbi:MAG: AAA family ATPase [Methylophaga sp.]|nr:AAA family ATPase [Methylophaga sp.]
MITGIDKKKQRLNNKNKGARMDIYNRSQVKQAQGKIDKSDPRYPLYEELLKTPPHKDLAPVTSELLLKLEKLKAKYPNFEQVTEEIICSLLLAFIGISKVLKTPPILLHGPAGIGKTRYLNDVAACFNVGSVKQIDMASASGGFIIGGHSTQWKDGRQGMVTKHLQESHYGNPILVLDEIDKVADNGHNPSGSLYNLLERHTAEKFIDEALELPMNCAHIIWFATANSLDKIPNPIKSRFEIYHVELPNEQQMKGVVNSIYSELLANNDWGGAFNVSLASAVINELKSYSPREIHRALWKACARAVQRGKYFIGKREQLIDLMPMDFEKNQEKSKKAIGFY